MPTHLIVGDGGHGGALGRGGGRPFCADLFTSHVSGSCPEKRRSEHLSVVRFVSFCFQAQPPPALTARALAASIYRRANLVRLRLIDSWPDWPSQVGCRRADREIPGVTHVDAGGVIATATTPGCVVVSPAVILPLRRLISAEWTYGWHLSLLLRQSHHAPGNREGTIIVAMATSLTIQAALSDVLATSNESKPPSFITATNSMKSLTQPRQLAASS